MAIINIKDFGAVGNGITNDTALINKAICSAKKGDTVYVPCGSYLVGTLNLKSDITFEMATDAVLIGSSDLSDYDEVLHDPNNRYMFEKSAYSPFATCGVLYLDMVENVEVIGVLLIFRRENSPYESAKFPLFAIDHDASYDISDVDGGTYVVDGQELSDGMMVSMPRRNAKILFYKKHVGDKMGFKLEDSVVCCGYI